MVRRVVWTSRAEAIFSEILKFYFKRNGTKEYSRKLNAEIKQLLNLVKKHPYIGKKTDTGEFVL
jgi:plasmid stabilization system protein ParE